MLYSTLQPTHQRTVSPGSKTTLDLLVFRHATDVFEIPNRELQYRGQGEVTIKLVISNALLDRCMWLPFDGNA